MPSNVCEGPRWLNAESIVTVDDVGAHELVQNADDARVDEQLREDIVASHYWQNDVVRRSISIC